MALPKVSRVLGVEIGYFHVKMTREVNAEKETVNSVWFPRSLLDLRSSVGEYRLSYSRPENSLEVDLIFKFKIEYKT